MQAVAQNTHNSDNKRVFGYDILRIICAFLVFMRHAITMYGVNWGINANHVLNTTNFIMTCFFILSGLSGKAIISFYKKRVMTIYPSYLILHLLYMVLIVGELKNGLILAPVSIFGISSMFRTLFGIFNFCGTWFVGCVNGWVLTLSFNKNVFRKHPCKVLYCNYYRDNAFAGIC